MSTHDKGVAYPERASRRAASAAMSASTMSSGETFSCSANFFRRSAASSLSVICMPREAIR